MGAQHPIQRLHQLTIEVTGDQIAYNHLYELEDQCIFVTSGFPGCKQSHLENNESI